MSHIDFNFSAADIWPCIDDFVARLIEAEGGDPAAPTREQLEAVERYLIDWMAKLASENPPVAILDAA